MVGSGFVVGLVFSLFEVGVERVGVLLGTDLCIWSGQCRTVACIGAGPESGG